MRKNFCFRPEVSSSINIRIAFEIESSKMTVKWISDSLKKSNIRLGGYICILSFRRILDKGHFWEANPFLSLWILYFTTVGLWGQNNHFFSSIFFLICLQWKYIDVLSFHNKITRFWKLWLLNCFQIQITSQKPQK